MTLSISQHIPAYAFGTAVSHSAQEPKDDFLTRLSANYLPVLQKNTIDGDKLATSRTAMSRFQKIEGGVWSAFWALLAYDLCKQSKECIKTARQELPSAEKSINLRAKIKKILVDSASLVGVSASLAEWADRVQLIVIGKYLSLVKKISYATYCISACFGIGKAIKTIDKEKKEWRNSVDRVNKIKHSHHYRLALIDLAAHVSTLAWSILGVAELITGIALNPVLMASIFMISCVFAFTSIGYSFYIASKVDALSPSTSSYSRV